MRETSVPPHNASELSVMPHQKIIAKSWRKQPILNVAVDELSLHQLLDELLEGVVFTLNPDHMFFLQRDLEFLRCYKDADFVTADSKYVYWGLKFLRRRIAEKVSGSDLVPAFLDFHRSNLNVKVFYLGAQSGVAQQAQRNSNNRAGREIVVGALSPSMNFVESFEEIQSAIALINSSGANVLIVGLGAPKQEKWIMKHRHLLPNVKIYMGVGAAIDYEAGHVSRAPSWMTQNGLEWVYRIATEPRRYWRRYARDLEYFWLLLLDKLNLYQSPIDAGESNSTKYSGRSSHD